MGAGPGLCGRADVGLAVAAPCLGERLGFLVSAGHGRGVAVALVVAALGTQAEVEQGRRETARAAEADKGVDHGLSGPDISRTPSSGGILAEVPVQGRPADAEIFRDIFACMTVGLHPLIRR